MGGTTSLNSRKNSKNRLSTTKCSKSNGICWVRCFSLDDDSHNSASFLSSPISTSVPKFNDNKPGNLYNINYLVYYHVILVFISFVAEYLSLSCNFFYRNLPFSLLGLFHHILVESMAYSIWRLIEERCQWWIATSKVHWGCSLELPLSQNQFYG